MTSNDTTARLWITEKVANLFTAEIRNVDGTQPATISSCIDSISQAPEILCEGWTPDDFVALLMIADLAGTDAELEDLIR